MFLTSLNTQTLGWWATHIILELRHWSCKRIITYVTLLESYIVHQNLIIQKGIKNIRIKTYDKDTLLINLSCFFVSQTLIVHLCRMTAWVERKSPFTSTFYKSKDIGKGQGKKVKISIRDWLLSDLLYPFISSSTTFYKYIYTH